MGASANQIRQALLNLFGKQRENAAVRSSNPNAAGLSPGSFVGDVNPVEISGENVRRARQTANVTQGADPLVPNPSNPAGLSDAQFNREGTRTLTSGFGEPRPPLPVSKDPQRLPGSNQPEAWIVQVEFDDAFGQPSAKEVKVMARSEEEARLLVSRQPGGDSQFSAFPESEVSAGRINPLPDAAPPPGPVSAFDPPLQGELPDAREGNFSELLDFASNFLGLGAAKGAVKLGKKAVDTFSKGTKAASKAPAQKAPLQVEDKRQDIDFLNSMTQDSRGQVMSVADQQVQEYVRAILRGEPGGPLPTKLNPEHSLYDPKLAQQFKEQVEAQAASGPVSNPLDDEIPF